MLEIKKQIIKGLLVYYNVIEISSEIETQIQEDLGDKFYKVCQKILKINEELVLFEPASSNENQVHEKSAEPDDSKDSEILSKEFKSPPLQYQHLFKRYKLLRERAKLLNTSLPVPSLLQASTFFAAANKSQLPLSKLTPELFERANNETGEMYLKYFPTGPMNITIEHCLNGKQVFLVNMAAVINDFKIVKCLFETINIEEAKHDGLFNPLYYAAREGHIEICRWLVLKKQMNVNGNVKSDAETPYSIAKENGHLEICKLLEENGEIEFINKIKSPSDKEAQAIMKPIEEINLKHRLFLKAIINGDETKTIFLLENKNIEVNEKIKSPARSIGLGRAASQGLWGRELENMIFYLTPLQYAVWFLRNKVCETLCRLGANVTDRDSRNDRTLWHFLIERYCIFINADQFVRSGIYLSAKPKLNFDEKELSQKVSTLAKILHSYKAPINKFDDFGYTPLQLAALSGERDLCELLVKYGANFDLKTTANNDSVLHLAATSGDIDTCKFFLQQGISVDIKNNSEQTALHIAAQKKHDNIFSFLIENGADLHAEDNEGKTPDAIKKQSDEENKSVEENVLQQENESYLHP